MLILNRERIMYFLTCPMSAYGESDVVGLGNLSHVWVGGYSSWLSFWSPLSFINHKNSKCL